MKSFDPSLETYERITGLRVVRRVPAGTNR